MRTHRSVPGSTRGYRRQGAKKLAQTVMSLRREAWIDAGGEIRGAMGQVAAERTEIFA